jgi:hypothetical protein
LQRFQYRVPNLKRSTSFNFIRRYVTVIACIHTVTGFIAPRSPVSDCRHVLSFDFLLLLPLALLLRL